MTAILRRLMAPFLAAFFCASAALAQGGGLDLDLDLDLRVELKAPAMVMLSAPAAGQLAEVAVRDGQMVKKGQLLLRIDDRLPLLRLQMAQAALGRALVQLQLTEKLHRLGSRGALDLEMARAQHQEVEAEMKMAQTMADLHRLTAPFDGRITQLEVTAGQHVPEGAPLVELAQDGPMEVEFMMPVTWLDYFQPGRVFEVRLDHGGEPLSAVVERLGGKVDPLTQSIRVYGRIQGHSLALRPGLSGWVVGPEAR